MENDGIELTLGSGRERTVLAMLLLEHNRVVAVDRLVDALWNERTPASSRQQVQICVSKLRRRFTGIGAPDLIRTRRPGYLLEVADEQIDVNRFGALVGAACRCLVRRPAEAEPMLRRALGMWRGQPLADVDRPWVRAAAATMSEMRAAAAEDWLAALLALGRHEEVCREVGDLLARHPLRERLVAHQVTALYRTGRTADALDAYRQARGLFVAELGLEPGPQLQALQRAVLDHDDKLLDPARPSPAPPQPARARPSPVARQLPRPVRSLIGRAALVERLRNHLLSPDGMPPVATLSGAGGVGKTTLAVHLAHLVRDRFPDGQLHVDLGGARRHPTLNTTQVLDRLLRGLCGPDTVIPEDVDQRLALYRSTVADRRLLMLFDDVERESDIRDLLPVTAGSATIVTSRRRLGGLDGNVQADVGILAPAEAARLLVIASQRRIDLDEPVATRRLVELCGRLPLALHVVAARLAARPHWTVRDLNERLESEPGRLDEMTYDGLAVRTGMAVAYGELSEPGQTLFRRLGLLHVDDFAGWVAVPLLNAGPAAAANTMEELVDARLVEVTGHDHPELRYRMHELVRVFSREQLAARDTESGRNAAMARLLGCLLHLAEEARRRATGHLGRPGTAPPGTTMHWKDGRVPLDPGHVDALLIEPRRWLEAHRPLLIAGIDQAVKAGLSALSHRLAGELCR